LAGHHRLLHRSSAARSSIVRELVHCSSANPVHRHDSPVFSPCCGMTPDGGAGAFQPSYTPLGPSRMQLRREAPTTLSTSRSDLRALARVHATPMTREESSPGRGGAVSTPTQQSLRADANGEPRGAWLSRRTQPGHRAAANCHDRQCSRSRRSHSDLADSAWLSSPVNRSRPRWLVLEDLVKQGF
jgi:hypothetical protein